MVQVKGRVERDRGHMGNSLLREIGGSSVAPKSRLERCWKKATRNLVGFC